MSDRDRRSLAMTRQKEPKGLLLKKGPHNFPRVAGFWTTLTLDKTMSDRKHLVSAEVQKLLDATKGRRHADRDKCLLLLMFRHGLRVSEACGLQLSQVDTVSRVLHVKRLKEGLSTTHPLRGDEIRAIKLAPFGRTIRLARRTPWYPHYIRDIPP